ncbi:class F sortase [Streptomyces sp. NPDC059082]|uniref:class F sortase n=1 Tax=Streptomyces sp. NPDC059082 TaxID=3346720 RepID=UPI0036745E7B
MVALAAAQPRGRLPPGRAAAAGRRAVPQGRRPARPDGALGRDPCVDVRPQQDLPVRLTPHMGLGPPPAPAGPPPLWGGALRPHGSLDVPPAADRNMAGWYADGTAPGAKGTAIVAGHVDNADGPAVFYTLGALRKGHRIEVDRADGRTAVFTVDAIEVYANKDFPDRKVYAEAARAEIRVITCGGGFSKKNGYQGNVVAFGHLIGVR